MTEKIYNAGIYCRVSRDDERDGASVSVENQKTMLTQYVLERGWNLIDCYIDDGYSGLDFQRPGVQRLLEDAASGRINVILVKDLSRFGRNYLAFGQYTDYFFPSVGCRFIAVNNGIDTENEAYIGNMVQGKYGTRSYKTKKMEMKPKEEWIRVEGTHEAIVPRELWDAVHTRSDTGSRSRKPSDGIKSIFSGLVYCADCCFRMRNSVERFTYKDGRPGRYSSFLCGNYSRSGKTVCTPHTINEKVLNELVLQDIRQRVVGICPAPEQIEQKANHMKRDEAQNSISACKKELNDARTRAQKVEQLMKCLHEDKNNGVISDSVFTLLMKKYQEEHVQRIESVQRLSDRIDAMRENLNRDSSDSEQIKRYTEIAGLDVSLLRSLIHRIEVGEVKTDDGERARDIRIIYRFAEC